MICYFDTSAFVPLLVPEMSSLACRRLWDDAADVVTSRLLYVEAAAALAQGVRMKRVTAARRRAALRTLDTLWADFYIVDPDESVVTRAAVLASKESLRAYDAVHCATAERLADNDLIFVSGDRQQLTAGAAIGLYVADVNNPDYL